MNIIKQFEQIRDIPYHIPLSLSEPNTSCSGKVTRLKQLLDQAGYTTRYRVCSFNWSALPLPTDVVSVSHTDDTTHVYLEVRMRETWIHIDPTWDYELRHIFPISVWDGITSTPIAVPPIEIFSIKVSAQIMAVTDPLLFAKDIAQNGRFYQALNTYLDTQRR